MCVLEILAGIKIGIDFFSGLDDDAAEAKSGIANSAAFREEANTVELQGSEAISSLRGEIGEIQGQQRAAFASSGVLINSGSAADVLDETIAVGNADAMTIKANTKRQAKALRDKANIQGGTVATVGFS